MKTYFELICICILSFGCQRVEKKDIPNYIATFENQTIQTETVDSLISEQVYQLRKNALKTLLRAKVIELQAHKLKVSKDELLKTKVDTNSTLSLGEYHKYILQHGSNSKNIDTTKVVRYLHAHNKQKQIDYFADSLLLETDIKVSLKLSRYDEVKLNDLEYHELSKGKEIIVYIISDYNCTACQNANKRISKIINKYRQIVNFRFVYFSEYIDKKALVAEAAGNQDKFIEIHNFLFNHPTLKADELPLTDFAIENRLSIDKLQEDIYNPLTIKNLLLNKDKILAQKIFVTPSFVVNNKLVNDEFSLYTLENLINEELEKNK